MRAAFFIGTAGWSLSRSDQMSFPPEGTHLERYAGVFDAAEINASFYRPLRAELYAKWAESTRDDFRFAVKLPKAITHEARLVGCELLLDAFAQQVAGLGGRLGPVLVQLPPKLELNPSSADAFLAAVRERFDGAIVIEPRHPSWFDDSAAERILARHRIGRVAADPARVPAAGEPGGHPSVVYYRLHGSPRIYWSAYDERYLDRLADRMRSAAPSADEVWCIFDNTASGSAIPNAWSLLERFM